MFRLLFSLIIFIFVTPQLLCANETLKTCHGKFTNPITDVCWSCLFPLSIGFWPVVKGHHPDTHNPKLPVCSCTVSEVPRFGLSVGFWEPISVVEVTRTPLCLVSLGGVQLNIGKYFPHGYSHRFGEDGGDSFYHVHWFRYPLLYWLNLLIDGACVQHGDLDIAYMTEFDPTWQDDELAFLVNPEAFLFATPPAQVACAADSIAATLHLPLDPLFWCAGSQGSMYPLTGHVQEHVGGVQASLLLAERMAFKLHRIRLLSDSSPDYDKICTPHHYPLLPKSRYRYQMLSPIATTGKNGCYPFGHATFTWESMHEYPMKGEDFAYLVWRKRNCCAF